MSAPQITPTYQHWDDALDARLRSMVEAGATYSEIGTALGRTRNACIGRAHRIGVISPGLPRPLSPQPRAVKRRAEKALGRLFDAAATTKQDNKPQPLYAQPEASTTPFGEPVTLMLLQPRHCRWPITQPDDRHLFCGADREGLGAYCREHSLVAFRPATRSLTNLAKAYR